MHDLRVCPVFHWSADRIKAHIAICFVVFALIRFLQYRIRQKTGEYFSPERISSERTTINISENHVLTIKDRQSRKRIR